MPILVGGTGLYFKALTQGLSAVPPTPPEIRAAVRARCDAEGAAALHAELARRDPAMAERLKPGDRMRIARALEVLEATGRSLADWHRDGMPAILDPDEALKIFLAVDRAELHRRIDARFDAMLAAGALDEVRALAARGLDPMLPAMKAHGVPWLRRHLAGEISLEEAAEGGKQRHPPLHQAAGHLVPPPDAGLDLACARSGAGLRRTRTGRLNRRGGYSAATCNSSSSGRRGPVLRLSHCWKRSRYR